MKKDVAAGIRAVETAAGQLCLEKVPAPAELESLATMDGKQLAQFAENWFTHSMGPWLVEQFQQRLIQQQQLSQEDAQFLAHWIRNKLLISPAGKRRMLLDLGQRCNAWAPEFSWNLMSQVLDAMPSEEQKKMFPHWAEEPYRPGLHPQTELTSCPICGGIGEPYQAALSGRINSFNALFLPVKLWMRCQHCGNLYSRHFPTEFLQLGAKPKVLEPTPNHMVTREVQATSLRIWSDILNKIRRYTDGTSLLEVGVGQGHLIAVAQEMGYGVTAVELIEADAQGRRICWDCP